MRRKLGPAVVIRLGGIGSKLLPETDDDIEWSRSAEAS